MKPWREAVADFKREYLIELLTLTQGDVSCGARIAGLNRTGFLGILRKLGVRAAPFRPVGSRRGHRGTWN